MRARSLDAAGWATVAIALCLATGGAAAAPEGWRLGLPSPEAALAAAGALVLVGLFAGWSAGRLFLGVAPVVLAVGAGLRIPGVAALAGPPIAVLVIACAVVALSRGRPRWAAAAYLPALALVYGLAAARVQAQVGPEGDEPHYLMVADSLLRDGDLSLERDYAEGRYRAFHPAPLAPHYRVRGKHGEIYSLHAVGLSLLLLPAYAAGSYAGASYFMALLAVWLGHELRSLLRERIGEEGEGAAWVLALSPPLVHYAGLLFTEVPAALVVAAALRRAGVSTSRRAALATGTAIALLPWLNVRYAIVTVALLAFALSFRPPWRRALAWVAPAVASAAALALHHFHLYGFFDPRRVYGRRPELSLGGLTTGLPGLLFDQEFGLLVYAPVFAIAVPGLVSLWRRSPRLAIVASGLVLAVVGVAGAWPMWRGGFNPPARFLVPVVPALALAVATQWRRGGVGAAVALLSGWSLWMGAIGTWDRALVHRDRDGTAPLLRAASGAEEWTRLLPGYVLEDSEHDRARLTMVWVVVLLVAAGAARRRREATAGGVAIGGVALVIAAGVASRLATARTHGRDAVRVVGRPAMLVPGWDPVASAPAVWTPAALDWGPLYEPHRAPDGAVLGGRLRLPVGTYRLMISGQEVPSIQPPPVLFSGPEGQPGSAVALSRQPGALAGAFEVAADQETTLRIRDGGPFIIKEIRVERDSTLSGGGGLNR